MKRPTNKWGRTYGSENKMKTKELLELKTKEVDLLLENHLNLIRFIMSIDTKNLDFMKFQGAILRLANAHLQKYKDLIEGHKK